jgi:hypothetical protein
MSQPVLQVANYYKQVTHFDVAVTPELVAYVRSTLGASSAFNGAAYSPTFLNDDLNNAKTDVVYGFPDDGSKYYYATVPSYKVVATNNLSLVISGEQRVIVQSNASSSFGPVTVTFYRHYGDNWQDGGNWHIDVMKLKPGECRVR